MNLVVPNILVQWNPLEDLLNQFAWSFPYQSWQGHRTAVLESSLMGLMMPVGNHTWRINELTCALSYSNVIVGLVLPKKTWEFDVLKARGWRYNEQVHYLLHHTDDRLCSSIGAVRSLLTGVNTEMFSAGTYGQRQMASWHLFGFFHLVQSNTLWDPI